MFLLVINLTVKYVWKSVNYIRLAPVEDQLKVRFGKEAFARFFRSIHKGFHSSRTAQTDAMEA